MKKIKSILAAIVFIIFLIILNIGIDLLPFIIQTIIRAIIFIAAIAYLSLIFYQFFKPNQDDTSK